MSEKSSDEIELMLQPLGNISNYNILDAGTGSATMALRLAQKIGNKGNITSVDIDPEETRRAIKLAAAKGLDRHVQFVKADLRKLNFIESGTIDLVTAYWTIHTIEEYTPGGTILVLSEFHRILKSGGTLVANGPYPDFKPQNKSQALYKRWEFLEELAYRTIGWSYEKDWAPDDLSWILAKTGFKRVHHRRIPQMRLSEGIPTWATSVFKEVRALLGKYPDLKWILEEMQQVRAEARKHGFTSPVWVLYATK